ncbi:MAG: hypothetical protein AAFQ65_10800 [Myxococcota bacterium]
MRVVDPVMDLIENAVSVVKLHGALPVSPEDDRLVEDYLERKSAGIEVRKL